jgi:hypothetical protein
VLMRRSAASAIAGHFVGRFCETPILNSAAHSVGACKIALADLSEDQSSWSQHPYARCIRVVPRDPRFQLIAIFRATDPERGQILRCQGVPNIRSGIARAPSSANRCASILLALGVVSIGAASLFTRVSRGSY